MKIVIVATDQITDMDGVTVRVWEGVTERGVKCKVFVHRLAVHKSENPEQFEQELNEELPPGIAIPLRMVL